LSVLDLQACHAFNRVFSISIQGCPPDFAQSFLHSSLQQQIQFNLFFRFIID
jgi:hypothetical protein